MASRKITVVLSQAPGKNPTKRNLEETIATELMLAGTAEVSVVPHLYDLPADHHAFLWLHGVSGDMVVLGWLFPRAIRWVLDRNGIHGKEGVTLLTADDEPAANGEADGKGIGPIKMPNRRIYVLDLRQQSDASVYVREIERIARETALPLIEVNGLSLNGANGQAGGAPKKADAAPLPASAFNSPFLSITSAGAAPAAPTNGHAEPKRRWYPVIDYSRCTNCMECIDFCLFGVYGIDEHQRILVEEQDNCKRGCPACSRVCPANAIIFPEHKTPAIAGAVTESAGEFKIDLSKLFGAPSALEIAAQERDTELVNDGRAPVGLSVGIPKRQAAKPNQPRDQLDDLMDSLDALE